MVHSHEDTPEDSRPVVSLGDVFSELLEGKNPVENLEERRLAVQIRDAENRLRGAVEHHLDIIRDPDSEGDAREDSRRGVMGDEADLLAIHPRAHDDPEMDT